ncbi:nucleoside permease [Compostibacter hankyongensis]|uniref:Nucleoside permease n=1 Tax=Compostibacter hankyongensis TaxID=1007089 RepID=A0ABP8FET6_9BACT
MSSKIRFQLSTMMFLEFFVWGAWFVTMGTYLLQPSGAGGLGVKGIQVGEAYLSQSLGAVIAPFIVGLIADRFFSAQRILGVLHLVGAVLLWGASVAASFTGFYLLILVYMILFMPTLALTNSIALRQMTDPKKEFPFIRVLGTVGWIVAGLIIGFLHWEGSHQLNLTFKMAAVASLVLGFQSFTLPDTLPLKKNVKVSVSELLGLDAIKLLKNRDYLVFFIASMAICIPTAFYYNFTNPFLNEVGMTAAAAKQTIGQFLEVVFMLLMPFFFKKLGVKKMLGLGMLAWAIRYICFAYGYESSGLFWLLFVGIAIHGVCYDYFFVTGQIYTDNKAGQAFQSAAQGLITLGTYGVGMLIGYVISGPIVDHWQLADGSHDWKTIWLIPAGIAAVVLVFFMAAFREKKTDSALPESI